MLAQVTPPVIAAGILFLGLTIDERSVIPIGSAAAIGLGLLWLGRRYQHIIDCQAELAKGQTALKDALKQINQKMDELPCSSFIECQNGGVSNHKKPK